MALWFEEAPTPRRRRWLWLVLCFALIYPTASALVYYLALPGPGTEASPAVQTAYVSSKVVQFAFPLLCALLLDRQLPWPRLPTGRGLMAGAAFGLLVAGGMLGLYFGVLRGTELFEEAAGRLRRELSQMGLASPGGFALLAVLITVPHSLLEEYYWRWFAFGWLRRLVPMGTAMLLSSAAFGAFHVVLLAEFFPGWRWFFLAVLPFGLCTGIGGAVWAWLYQRDGSICVPWFSHLIVDAALFVLGYDLYFGME
jgi:membrane protease YdiL (CAAX protease family)